jgi:hypothetical protein
MSAGVIMAANDGERKAGRPRASRNLGVPPPLNTLTAVDRKMLVPAMDGPIPL